MINVVQQNGQAGLYGETARMRVLDGDAGTLETVQVMRALAHDGATNSSLVHRVAAKLVASAPRNDQLAQLSALNTYLRRGIVFKPDTFGAEHLRSPDQLLTEIQADGRTSADCDDVTILAIALLRAMGIKPQIALVGRSENGTFEHVHPVAVIAGAQIPFDPQENTTLGTWTTGNRRAVFDG